MSLRSPGAAPGWAMWWHRMSLKGEALGWLPWGSWLRLQASGLTHTTGLGASQGATERLSGSHTRCHGPCQLSLLGAGQDSLGRGAGPKGSRPFDHDGGFFSTGTKKKRIPLRRMNYKADCSGPSSKARGLGKGSLAVRKASKDSQAVCLLQAAPGSVATPLPYLELPEVGPSLLCLLLYLLRHDKKYMAWPAWLSG